jgi:hypothetical protein
MSVTKSHAVRLEGDHEQQLATLQRLVAIAETA